VRYWAFVGEQNLYITLCDAIILIITIYYTFFAPAKVEIVKLRRSLMLLSAVGCDLFHHGDCFEHPTGQQSFVR
jgi:hypothetical protein